MNEKNRRRIEALIDGLKCPKDFKCVQCGVESLCKAIDVGMENYLVCLEEDAAGCPFAVSVRFESQGSGFEKEPRECQTAASSGIDYLCQCPLRVYMAKNAARLSDDKTENAAAKQVALTKQHVINLIGKPQDVLRGPAGTEFMMYRTKGIFVRLDKGSVHSFGLLRDAVVKKKGERHQAACALANLYSRSQNRPSPDVPC